MPRLKNAAQARQPRQPAHQQTHRHAARRGFTLIEIMIALALLAILSVLAVPSFNVWIANSRVRAVGSDLADGLRLAQAESLRRNRPVVFALTNAVNPESGYTAVTNGSNWAVSVAKPSWNTGASTEFVRGGSNTELMKSGVVLITGNAATCFSSLGRLAVNTNTGIDGASCEALPSPPQAYTIHMSGADHDLRVEVGLGGQVRLCNPALTLSATAPEGCEGNDSST